MMSDGSQRSQLTISDPQESVVYICEVNTGIAGYTTSPASQTEVQLIVIKPGNLHYVRRFLQFLSTVFSSHLELMTAMMIKRN